MATRPRQLGGQTACDLREIFDSDHFSVVCQLQVSNFCRFSSGFTAAAGGGGRKTRGRRNAFWGRVFQRKYVQPFVNGVSRPPFSMGRRVNLFHVGTYLAYFLVPVNVKFRKKRKTGSRDCSGKPACCTGETISAFRCVNETTWRGSCGARPIYFNTYDVTKCCVQAGPGLKNGRSTAACALQIRSVAATREMMTARGSRKKDGN